KLYPTYETTLLQLARIRQAEGKTDEELAFYKKAIEEQGTPASMITLASRLEELGQFQEALNWYGRVIETEPFEPFQRGRAAMLAGYMFARKIHKPER